MNHKPISRIIKVLLLTSLPLAALVAGCGGGEEDTGAAPATTVAGNAAGNKAGGPQGAIAVGARNKQE